MNMTPAEARAIAKEAYIYGFPMVDNMRVQYQPLQGYCVASVRRSGAFRSSD